VKHKPKQQRKLNKRGHYLERPSLPIIFKPRMIEVIMILSPHLPFKKIKIIWKKRGVVLGRNVEPKPLSRATQSKVFL